MYIPFVRSIILTSPSNPNDSLERLLILPIQDPPKRLLKHSPHVLPSRQRELELDPRLVVVDQTRVDDGVDRSAIDVLHGRDHTVVDAEVADNGDLRGDVGDDGGGVGATYGDWM